MRTIIRTITNLDATVRGLRNIVRTLAPRTFVSVTRGVVLSVRHDHALLMRLVTDAMAKPAYAMLPSVAPLSRGCRHAMGEQQRSQRAL